MSANDKVLANAAAELKRNPIPIVPDRPGAGCAGE
jgi:hypothetical protein